MENIFVQPDLSQAEARVVAYLSGCTKLIGLFNDPTKSIHMENANNIFGHYPKKDGPEYQMAKKVTHAANYRITSGFFSTMAGIPPAEAEKLLEAYHSAYPEIREWHEWVLQRIAEPGLLRTPFGRERIFCTARAELMLFGKISNNSWKDAISYTPQATVPDVVNRGMVKLWESPVGEHMRFHQQGHDSFVASCPEELLGEVAVELKRCLTLPFEIRDIKGTVRELTIPVDLAWGYSWGAMKNYDGETVGDRRAWEAWMSEKNVWNDIETNLLD